MDLRLKRAPGLYLVGFMGSGKTTVGRLLAERLGWLFVDLDDEIEAREGVLISHIFETRGEAAFRLLETEAIRRRVREIECGRAAVVALGGGAFTVEENRRLLADNGVSVWLDCSFEMVKRRVGQHAHRPLARDPVRFAELYEARRECYACADYRVPVDADDPEPAVEAVLALPIFR